MNVPHTPFPPVVPHVIPDRPAELHQREVELFNGWLLSAKMKGPK